MNVHLLVPSEVVTKLSVRFALRHKVGFFGYFSFFLPDEFWAIVKSLVDENYRVDIKPGKTTKLMARKERPSDAQHSH